MKRPEDLLSFNGISCMSFNKDYTQCAVSHKDKYINIYKVTNIQNSSEWVLLHTLKEVRFIFQIISIMNIFHALTGITKQIELFQDQ